MEYMVGKIRSKRKMGYLLRVASQNMWGKIVGLSFYHANRYTKPLKAKKKGSDMFI